MAEGNVSFRLRQAVVLNDLPLMQRLLKTNPAYLQNPDYSDKSNTSLHLAAKHGLLHIAQHLISLGHDGSIPVEDDMFTDIHQNQGISINTDGQTPLHLAAANMHTSVVELLCRTFPDTINRVDKEGCTPLLLGAKSQSKPTSSPGFQMAKQASAPADDTSTIETLLHYHANPEAYDINGNTCLHYACAWGNLKAVRILIKAGVDPARANHAGWKPEFYSLTVQAEVYYRNLVAEYEKQKAEEQIVSERRGKGGGAVRIVTDDDDDDDDDDDEAEDHDNDSDSTEFYLARSRSGSAKSQTTIEGQV